jgi:integrase
MVSYLDSAGFSPIGSISSAHLLSYKSTLSRDTEYYLGTLSGMLRKWHRLGITGVDSDAYALLGDLRIPGNPKGAAVLTADPARGAFTDIELQAIQSALDTAYSNGSLEERHYLLVWLFIALGARPRQLAALKVKDFSVVEAGSGRTYLVSVPRAKKRNAEIRGQFKRRPLVAHIGEHLSAYADGVRAHFESRLRDPEEAPLFPGGDEQVIAPGFAFHLTAKRVTDIVTAVFQDLDVHSERTGRAMHVSPVRFRRTMGTRAAQEGHGALIIAEMLDHEDTQNVGIYIAATPEIAQRIDRAMALDMAPLAQAFQGVLVDDESSATRAGDPSSRIRDLRIDDGAPMGSCGQHSFCGLNAPVACYTCRSFEPWLDGPHDAVLEHLLARREQLSTTTDSRIAAINDRTILAVARVVQLVRERRGGSADQ